METAKEMKKRKDEEAKQKELGGISANAAMGMFKGVSAMDERQRKESRMETAKPMKPVASSVARGILKDIVGEKAKDENAVTEIDGEIVKWKAGKNPAYEEKLMKLKKKK